MENVDRAHKWYWLGYRIQAIHGGKNSITHKDETQEIYDFSGQIYGIISFHFIYSLWNFLLAVYIMLPTT